MNMSAKELSNTDFDRLSKFIYTNYGIKMPPAKKIMLQARLQTRLRANNMGSFKEYCDYVLSNKSDTSEIVHMIDVVSTNKTDFFRESAHFNFLEDIVLPEFYEKNAGDTIRIWSAASSSGEEIYTIAMVVNEFIEKNKKMNFSILGTDISSRILEKAAKAIYHIDRLAPVTLNLKRKYLLRNKNKEIKDVRIVPELRKKTSFQRLNLMDTSYPVPKNFDVIFCRNVLIYFDRETQEKVINKLCMHLKPGGYFFLGHSESITGIEVPLKQLQPTVFKRI